MIGRGGAGIDEMDKDSHILANVLSQGNKNIHNRNKF